MLATFSRSVWTFLRQEDGPTSVEYGVMVAVIIIVCMTTVATLGTNNNNTFSYVSTKVTKGGS